MDTIGNRLYTEHEVSGLADTVAVLRTGREAVLRDWVERVRANTTMQTGQELTEPLLLDHMPQLFDAVLDRLEVNRSREDAEQYASIHGFARRLSGYNVAETVLELLLFRRAIWAHLVAVGARVDAAYPAMEQIDGMVDRAIMASLLAYLDPTASFLRTAAGEGNRGDGASADGASADGTSPER